MLRWPALLTLGLIIAHRLSSAPVPAASPQLYAGTWRVSRKSVAGKPDVLKNTCAQAGTYFVCQQNVNGAVSGLIVFAPASQPGHFNTQTVQPDGRATGKGDLTIEGSKMIFTSSWNNGTSVIHYRTTNTFLNPNQIQFTQEESTDASHWELKDSGEDVRVSR